MTITPDDIAGLRAEVEQELREAALTDERASWRYPFDAQQAALSSILAGKAADLIALLTARIEALEGEKARLEALINTPETEDWLRGVEMEAAHQIERWGADHDVGKSPFDWFWLIGYLAQKAAASAVAGDNFKAKHHTISTGAALLNWHRHLVGSSSAMRPGIDPTERGIELTKAREERTT